MPQMNYAVAILLFVFVLASVYWWLRGRFYYIGPRHQAHLENGVIVPDDSSEIVSEEVQDKKQPPPV